MAFSAKEISELKKRAAQLRGNLIDMIPPGKVGHLGGSSSIMDVVAALYFKTMRVFDDPKDPRRDRLVFSKGHAVLAQYAAFVELGYVEREALKHVKTLDGTLQGHPDMDHTPGIEAVTGSLGQGLSVCLGMAFGLRVDGSDSRVYCVLGDGELAEGQIWEATMFAAHYHLDNLCIIVDLNGLQIDGRTCDVMNTAPVDKKFEAFGCDVVTIDGHCFDDIEKAMEKFHANHGTGKPTAVLMTTVKGKGISYMENQAGWHGKAPNDDEYAQAMAELSAARSAIEEG